MGDGTKRLLLRLVLIVYTVKLLPIRSNFHISGSSVILATTCRISRFTETRENKISLYNKFMLKGYILLCTGNASVVVLIVLCFGVEFLCCFSLLYVSIFSLSSDISRVFLIIAYLYLLKVRNIPSNHNFIF